MSKIVMFLQIATVYDEFEHASVVDLGCGTGMLSIGAAMLGAGHVIGIDIDQDALDTALENISEYEDDLPIDLVHSDVTTVGARHQPWLQADTVIMNPPFGTRRKGADMEFLKTAFSISTHTIYSLHKTSTRAYIEKFAMQTMGAVSAEPVAMLRYDLPATYKFHTMKSVDISVDIWRFEVAQSSSS